MRMKSQQLKMLETVKAKEGKGIEVIEAYLKKQE